MTRMARRLGMVKNQRFTFSFVQHSTIAQYLKAKALVIRARGIIGGKGNGTRNLDFFDGDDNWDWKSLRVNKNENSCKEYRTL